MVTQQRQDLQMNIPALRKLDAMLLVSMNRNYHSVDPMSILSSWFCDVAFFSLAEQAYLDSFEGKQEFWYASKDGDKSEKGNTPRQDDKWWLPTVRVPANGLSDSYRKWLQHMKDLVAQVLKAAMAINANVLMEMEVPDAYMESLPKVIYKTT